MNVILTLSSQGQVVIPSKVRKLLGVKSGEKLSLTISNTGILPTAVIQPQPKSWTKVVTGLGKGIWGKGEEYIRQERKSWER